jgi:beta-glucosidase
MSKCFRVSALWLVLLLFTWVAAAQDASSTPQGQNRPVYLDPDQPLEMRLDDLLHRLTVAEKISQMQDVAPAIERLHIPAYNWWNEGLHGVARAGYATVFPQAIGLAATWDDELMLRVADVISTEARAKYNDAIAHGSHERYFGLTFWSPNINIFRDPRWGRGQETYGEDPYLTGRMGVAFVKGLQGKDPKYLKTISTPKHYAVHSGPEVLRHSFDVPVSAHDLADTYLPAFRASIVEGKAQSVMCAYNSVSGAPACANAQLLGRLRQEWQFNGYVVSDCGAISDVFAGHRYAARIEQAAAIAVKAGTDLSCGKEYSALAGALNDGLLSQADIDQAVRRLMRARFQLGMFDPPEGVAYSRIPMTENDSEQHRQMALQAARESIVLLKNANGFLPLQDRFKRIAVVGPDSDSLDVLVGNYNGTPSRPVTPLAGMKKRFGAANITYAQGSVLAETSANPTAAAPPIPDRGAAVKAAQNADVVVAFVGISPNLEGEEMSDVSAPGFFGGDRVDLDLPRPQQEMLEAVAATGKPLVVVLLNGSALAVNWAQQHAAAVLDAWYPGEEGGTAIAEVLAGDYNPGGRLPVTFYKSVGQLPAFTNYSMAGRTYRYFHGEPLFGFGDGLSFSRFEYSGLQISSAQPATNQPVEVSVTVRNASQRAGDEVVELYIDREVSSAAMPFRTLQGFRRVHLNAGATTQVVFSLSARQLAFVDEAGKLVETAGKYVITVGGHQPGTSGVSSAGELLQQAITIHGPAAVIEP